MCGRYGAGFGTIFSIAVSACRIKMTCSMGERMTRRWRPTPFIAVSVALHAFCLVIFAFSPRLWPWLLALIAANHAVIMLLGLWPRSHWLGSNWTRLPAMSAARGEIALTIDDGPDPVVTPQVLALLDRYGVRATFFCIGEQAERYPQLCREIVRRTHSWVSASAIR